MTREEAIRKTLDTVLWTRNASNDNKNILTDALIKALEQEPILDKIRVEILNKIHHILDGELIIELKEVLQILDKYKTDKEQENGK